MPLTIILLLPVLNELEGLKATLPYIDRSLFTDVVVVDGGSTDGTIEYAWQEELTIVSQLRKGLQFAVYDMVMAHDVDYIVEFSPDGNCQPEYLKPLVDVLKQGVSLAVVSRYLRGARSYDDNFITAFGNWIFTKGFSLLGPAAVTDSLGIYRGFKRDIVKDPLFEKMLVGPVFEPLVTGICQIRKYPLAEIAGDEPPRIGGETKRSIFVNGSCILYMLLRLYRRKLFGERVGLASRG